MNPDNIYAPGVFRIENPKSVHLVHKNGTHRIVSLGFCWSGFLVPPLWALSEGLWRPFAFSLLFFLADMISNAVAFSCEQGVNCAAVPFAALLKLAGFPCYVFAMGYFGYKGKELLITDLLNHGYLIEGAPRPIEPDERES